MTPTQPPACGKIIDERKPIMNGDHAQYEIDNAGIDPKLRCDWPLPSFDANDWAKAFCQRNICVDKGAMIAWFANALMRGYDEGMSRASSHPAPVADERAEVAWLPIESAPKGRKVLAGYFNQLGKWRTITAYYYRENELENDEAESGFAPEGWYEESDSLEEITATNLPPTHWMPLPGSPSAQPSGALGREEVGASVPSRPLEHRWYGSGPNRGDYLYIDRKEVAYLGDQHHTQVSSLVYEVNKLFMERAK